MARLVIKGPLFIVNIFLLFTALIFTACQSDTNTESEQTSIPLKPVVLNLEDPKSGSTYTLELGYPEGWEGQMVNNHVFRATESPETVANGFINNFHATVFADSLNHDLKWYSNDFLVKEQAKFRNTNFEVEYSGQFNPKGGMDFRMDYIKIWGGANDTLFSISALAKTNKRIVHLNFYGNYADKETVDNLAKSIVGSVRVKG